LFSWVARKIKFSRLSFLPLLELIYSSFRACKNVHQQPPLCVATPKSVYKSSIIRNKYYQITPDTGIMGNWVSRKVHSLLLPRAII